MRFQFPAVKGGIQGKRDGKMEEGGARGFRSRPGDRQTPNFPLDMRADMLY
jgi:hypothetical protein